LNNLINKTSYQKGEGREGKTSVKGWKKEEYKK